MTTVKIQLKESIINKIKGKTLIDWSINNKNELELEPEECQLFDRLDKVVE
jgi:hypothetical protein